MTRIQYIALLFLLGIINGCSLLNPSRQDLEHLPATVFDSDPNNIRFKELYYFVEVTIDSLLETQHPVSYAVGESVVFPIPKDISVLFLKVQTIDDYYHAENPFFWAYSNVDHFAEELKNENDYGMCKTLEYYDSLISLGKVPTTCNYLYLPVKRDSVSSIIKAIDDKRPIVIQKDRFSGDTVWAVCYYEKGKVNLSLLLSFKQRVSIMRSWKETAMSQIADSAIISNHKKK